MSSTATVAGSIDTYVGGRQGRMQIGGELVESAESNALVTHDPQPVNRWPRCLQRAQPTSTRRSAGPRPPSRGGNASGSTVRPPASPPCANSSSPAVRSWLDAIDCGDPVRAMRTDVDICLGYLDAYPSMVYGV